MIVGHIKKSCEMSIDSVGNQSRAEVELGQTLLLGCTQIVASAPPKLLAA